MLSFNPSISLLPSFVLPPFITTEFPNERQSIASDEDLLRVGGRLSPINSPTMTAEGTTGTGGTDGYNYEHPETAGETDDDLSPNTSSSSKTKDKESKEIHYLHAFWESVGGRKQTNDSVNEDEFLTHLEQLSMRILLVLDGVPPTLTPQVYSLDEALQHRFTAALALKIGANPKSLIFEQAVKATEPNAVIVGVKLSNLKVELIDEIQDKYHVWCYNKSHTIGYTGWVSKGNFTTNDIYTCSITGSHTYFIMSDATLELLFLYRFRDLS